jgi:molybdopterin molybdotransferase
LATAEASRLLPVEDALDAVLAPIRRPLEAEAVAPEAALGRWLADPVVATTDLPPWDNSAMDGYAVRAVDTSGSTEDAPVRVRVVGEIAAGAWPDIGVGPGTAVRIATGARIPAGADAVVPVELTTPLDAAGVAGPRGREAAGPLPAACLVHEPVPVGGSIRARAGDLSAGTVVLAAGTRMTAAVVALAAGAGAPTVSVHRRPRVGVLATGDEVRAAGEPLGEAGIPDANGPGLRALVAASGAEAIALGTAKDVLEDVAGRLGRGLREADVVIVSGGVSVGPYDVVRAAFEAVGTVSLWRVAVQPGKPFAFGTAERPGGGEPVLLFGLPGNPVSTAVTFELFVRPALRRLAGEPRPTRNADRGVLLEPVSKARGRRTFLRVAAEREPDGRPSRDERGRVPVRLAGGQGSHVLSALAAADALAIVPEADESLPAGADVALWWLDGS